MQPTQNRGQWGFSLKPGFPPSDQNMRQSHMSAYAGEAPGKGLNSIWPAYEHVLEYPKGIDHFKYFDDIPHPERYSQQLLDIYASQPKVDLNPDMRLQQMEFERIKKLLAPQLSENDVKLMRLPDAVREILAHNNDPNETIAGEHLIRSFYNFFSTPNRDDVPVDTLWIDYNFATNYRMAKLALQDLTNNLFNAKATKKLIEKLRIAGAFGNEKKDFYFWNTPHKYWSDMSYQARSVQHYKGELLPLKNMVNSLWESKGLPSQYKALGDFTINALPESTVIPKGNGRYDICVNDMYYFVNDIFNFEGEELLGKWDLNYKSEKPILIEPYFPTYVLNSDFRKYQRHGYGRYFPVLSRLHKVKNFIPQCLRNCHVK